MDLPVVVLEVFGYCGAEEDSVMEWSLRLHNVFNLTICVGMPNLLLSVELMDAVIVWQGDSQRKGCPLYRPVEVPGDKIPA